MPGAARFTTPSVPDKAALIQRMHDYVQQGVAFDLEDNEPSVRCVAAPIRDAAGVIVAAVSVSSTVPYMPLQRPEDLVPTVVAIAGAVSAELGFTA